MAGSTGWAWGVSLRETTSTTNAAFIDYLSVAIAVWAPVNGHVCIDLENVRQQVRDEHHGDTSKLC